MDLFTSAKNSISSVSSVTIADERSISVGASSVVVTVVEGNRTFIDIYTCNTKLLHYHFRMVLPLLFKYIGSFRNDKHVCISYPPLSLLLVLCGVY